MLANRLKTLTKVPTFSITNLALAGRATSTLTRTKGTKLIARSAHRPMLNRRDDTESTYSTQRTSISGERIRVVGIHKVQNENTGWQQLQSHRNRKHETSCFAPASDSAFHFNEVSGSLSQGTAPDCFPYQ